MDQQSRRVGQYEVLILRDGVFEAPADVLTHAAGESARAGAIARWGRPTISIDVNCFALRDSGGITLVDAGTGASWGDAFGHVRTALNTVGIDRSQVGRILITHLHGDHALGLFDGEEPYFPQAEILVPELDLAYFTDTVKQAATPKAKQGGFDIAGRLLRLYPDRVRAITEGEILPGIEALLLPGHTHGHSGYLIRDRAHSLLLWGDAVHLSDLQAADPDVGLAYDLDGAMASRTRHAILERAARERWIVSGGHVQGFREVKIAASGYATVPAQG